MRRALKQTRLSQTNPFNISGPVIQMNANSIAAPGLRRRLPSLPRPSARPVAVARTDCKDCRIRTSRHAGQIAAYLQISQGAGSLLRWRWLLPVSNSAPIAPRSPVCDMSWAVFRYVDKREAVTFSLFGFKRRARLHLP